MNEEPKQDPEEIEKLKRAIFDRMAPRRQKQVLKRGYEKWDPFIKPKDPIDIRRDQTKRTTHRLISNSCRLGSRAANQALTPAEHLNFVLA